MTQPLPTIATCPACGTQIPQDLLVCPGCGRLVHAQYLTELAADAKAAADAGNPIEAARLWREALELLPPNSKQAAVITQKIAALAEDPPTSPQAPASSNRSGKVAAGLTGVALLLWKLKFALVFILTKGKLLLLGLTKGSTFITMFLSLGVYWSAWGWKFAAGLVISIYIHEMGHVDALRRYGFKATAPTFIPGLGAVIRLKQHPTNPSEDARIGLAGPLWGLAAATVAYAVWLITHNPFWGAMAHVGAVINLFNLIPIWQLDGGRGFHALSRHQAWLTVLLAAALWFYTTEGMLMLIMLVGIFQALAKKPETPPDRGAMFLFGVLLVALAVLSTVKIPMTNM